MQAWILREAGRLPSLETVADLVPGAGEAVVDLRAAALNHRDVWLQQGSYFTSKYPVILGGDGAGVVGATGDGVDPIWRGTEVIINPGVGWGDSETFALDSFKTLGTPQDGTFAEQIVVPAAQLHHKPAHLDFVHAAALPLSGVTGYRALFSQGRLKAGETVLISGAGGGVAQFMLQFAVAAGASVYVTSSSDAKIAQARAKGAAGGANYRHEDWGDVLMRQVPHGFDLIVDSACGSGFPQFVDLSAPGGRIVFFGLTAGPPPALDMRTFYRKQLSLIGTKMGSSSDFAAMLDFVASHGIVPEVDSVYPFDRIADAFAKLDEGGHFGKIAFSMDRNVGETG